MCVCVCLVVCFAVCVCINPSVCASLFVWRYVVVCRCVSEPVYVSAECFDSDGLTEQYDIVFYCISLYCTTAEWDF